MTTDLEDLEGELGATLRASVRAGHPDPPGLSEAAAQAGLLDVAYATLDSPVGALLLAATPGGLVRIAYLGAEPGPGQPEDAVLHALAERLSPRILAAPAKLDGPRRELEEYFEGRRRAFALALDWRLMSPFGRRVLQATAGIGYGSVSTYGEVAARAGSPRGSRAAGNALGANPLPIVIPCHRVMRSGGAIGGYTGGLERKRTLLALERGQSPLTPL